MKRTSDANQCPCDSARDKSLFVRLTKCNTSLQLCITVDD